MRDYAKRYGRQSYTVCGMQVAAQPEMMEWLSLYRSDPEAHFSESERVVYSQLMAHLHEALQINWRLNLGLTLTMEEPDEVLAIADPCGYLHTPPSEIVALLRAEWPNLTGGRLPEPLVGALAASREGNYLGRAVFVHSRMVGGLLFLRVRRRSLLDGLSTRERQVAETVARGLSAKESGKVLGLAPATVRVHLQRIYEKLSVHSQGELAYLIGRFHPHPSGPQRPVVREAG